MGYLRERGLTEFLVFGAGVPTQGNVHEVAQATGVLYTDIDPVTIELGQRILAGDPAAAYTFGNATDLTTIDDATLRRTLPGWGSRPVGIVFLGLAAFLDDDQLARALDDLYQATAPGSLLAFDFDSEALADHPEALAMMGPQFRMRRPHEFAALLGRWELTVEGISAVADWPDSPSSGGGEGSVAAFYGGVAAH